MLTSCVRVTQGRALCRGNLLHPIRSSIKWGIINICCSQPHAQHKELYPTAPLNFWDLQKLEYSRESRTPALNSSVINTTLPALDQQDLNEKSSPNPPLWKENIYAFKASSASFLHSSQELICSPRQVRTLQVTCEQQVGKRRVINLAVVNMFKSLNEKLNGVKIKHTLIME